MKPETRGTVMSGGALVLIGVIVFVLWLGIVYGIHWYKSHQAHEVVVTVKSNARWDVGEYRHCVWQSEPAIQCFVLVPEVGEFHTAMRRIIFKGEPPGESRLVWFCQLTPSGSLDCTPEHQPEK